MKTFFEKLAHRMSLIYHNDKLFFAIIISVTMLQFLDVASTYLAGNLGATEANPLFKSHVENGNWGFLLLSKLIFISFAILPALYLRKIFHTLNKKWQKAILGQFSALYFLNWLYFVLVADNTYVLYGYLWWY